jgi:hypothetical protein
VSRRKGAPWAATSVPEVRRQWCNALDQIVDRVSEGLAPAEPGTPAAGNRRLERTQAKLATEIEIMKSENTALRGAELFWVARDMVDVSVDAASTLPEWTPALVTPAPSGLLCWAKPAGTVPYGPNPAAATKVPWDAVWWWTRPDGMLQLVPSSRFTEQPELVAPYEVATPLWPAHTIVINPKEPRTEEANGTEAAHPLCQRRRGRLAVDGPTRRHRNPHIHRHLHPPAGGQSRPRHRADTKGHDRRTAPPDPASPRHKGKNHRSAVQPTLVGRRALAPAGMRTQPQRTPPKWIAPYIKGPQDKPLTTERVNVWRR